MKRHYYISDDLNELEAIEIALEAGGVDTAKIHVLSNNDAGVESHHLHAVDSLSKKDLVHSGTIGLSIGLVGAAIILYLSLATGITESYTWAPALFLSVAFVGFCTWEGGLLGIQKTNHDYAQFDDVLAKGSHVFFVDVNGEQEELLNAIIDGHPRLTIVGDDMAAGEWVAETR